MAGRATSPKTLAALERQARALEMRRQGHEYQVIADELGYSGHSGARKAVETALKRAVREPALELVILEDIRLDSLLLSLRARLEAGDLGAIDRAIRIAERRARLHGLDAPSRTELSGPEGRPLHPPSAPWAPDQAYLVDVLTVLREIGKLPAEVDPLELASHLAPPEPVLPAQPDS